MKPSCNDLDDSLLVKIGLYLDIQTLRAWLSLSKRYSSLKLDPEITKVLRAIKPSSFKQWYNVLTDLVQKNTRPYNFTVYLFRDVNEFREASMLKYVAFQSGAWLLSSLRLAKPQTTLEYEVGLELIAQKYRISPDWTRLYINRAKVVKTVFINLTLLSLFVGLYYKFR